MAQCALCRDETEIYAGGDIPICVECSDARKGKGMPSPVGEQPVRSALLEAFRDAAARNDEASREFQAVMGRLPSVLRHP